MITFDPAGFFDRKDPARRTLLATSMCFTFAAFSTAVTCGLQVAIVLLARVFDGPVSSAVASTIVAMLAAGALVFTACLVVKMVTYKKAFNEGKVAFRQHVDAVFTLTKEELQEYRYGLSTLVVIATNGDAACRPLAMSVVLGLGAPSVPDFHDLARVAGALAAIARMPCSHQTHAALALEHMPLFRARAVALVG